MFEKGSYTRAVNWFNNHYWTVCGVELGIIIVLFIYGVVSNNGFSAKGY